jgi:hypothetical protein
LHAIKNEIEEHISRLESLLEASAWKGKVLTDNEAHK